MQETNVADTEVAFWDAENLAIGQAQPHDDLLHPELNAKIEGDSLTETQYLGFSIPEEQIHCLCYMWHHVNLGVVTGGVWVWQGVTRHNFQSQIFDFSTYESDSCLANDLHEYKLACGYHVQTLEPLKHHRIRYSDPVHDNHLDVELRAVTPAALLASGLHLEQGMKTDGTLTLRGREYKVDGYTVRDRSWGALRPEHHQDLPPMSWMNCTFGEDFAFGAWAYDSLDTDPEWKGVLELPESGNCPGGWIWDDGKFDAIVSARKRTERDFDSLYPTSGEMTLTTASGRDYDFTATMSSGGNWRTWMNFDAAYCTTRWECDGRVSDGDWQEAQYREYIRRFMGNPSGR